MVDDEKHHLGGMESHRQLEIFHGFNVVLSSSVFEIKKEHADGVLKVVYDEYPNLGSFKTRFKIITKLSKEQLQLIDENKLARYMGEKISAMIKECIPYKITVQGISFKEHSGFSDAYHGLNWGGVLAALEK